MRQYIIVALIKGSFRTVVVYATNPEDAFKTAIHILALNGIEPTALALESQADLK